MTISSRLRDYIEQKGTPYETVPHHRTATSRQSALAAHVPGSRVAKSVVLHHDSGYAVAVLPSTHRVEIATLEDILERPLGLASEDEVATLFDDCDVGAVPPLGEAYDVPVVIDESLAGQAEIYFEGGDHRTLVHVSGSDFRDLMSGARVARFSHPAV